MYGGAGKDVFIVAINEGSDVIADFTAADDRIQLADAKTTVTGSDNDSDVVLSLKNGSKTGTITVKDAAASEFSVYWSNGTAAYNHAASGRAAEAGFVESELLDINNFVTEDVDLLVDTADRSPAASRATAAIEVVTNYNMANDMHSSLKPDNTFAYHSSGAMK